MALRTWYEFFIGSLHVTVLTCTCLSSIRRSTFTVTTTTSRDHSTARASDFQWISGGIRTINFREQDQSNKHRPLRQPGHFVPEKRRLQYIESIHFDQLIDGEEHRYYSIDSIKDKESEESNVDELENYTVEYFNSLMPSGLPPHELILKKGAIVTLIRNLNEKHGLVNGTRMELLQLHRHSLHVKILTGDQRGKLHLIPKIELSLSEDIPFMLKRIQFPIRPAFAVTINKSQGQTFQRIGIYLLDPVFAHGQLYVAFSLVSSF